VETLVESCTGKEKWRSYRYSARNLVRSEFSRMLITEDFEQWAMCGLLGGEREVAGEAVGGEDSFKQPAEERKHRKRLLLFHLCNANQEKNIGERVRFSEGKKKRGLYLRGEDEFHTNGHSGFPAEV
jgi:hypothetical protein